MTLRRGNNKGMRKPSPKHPHHAKYDYTDVRVAKCFVWMQDRVAAGLRRARVCEWPRTREGFLAFAKEMGSIPVGMKRPSVGRIDHDKGYVTGNVKWEEHSFNSWRGRRPEQPMLDEVAFGAAPSPDDEEIPF